MWQAEAEVERYLTLLRNKIRQQGFTQLEVQESLSWGRSYISQLLTKQKSLRVEQVLLILNVIGIEPADFFAELYSPGYVTSRSVPRPQPPEPTEEQQRAFQELRALLRGLVGLLLEKQLVTDKELSSAATVVRREPDT